MQDVLAAGFTSWLVWMAVHGLMQVLHSGRIKNRRGPDIDVTENPLVFWGLSGFFGLGTILVSGLAILCLWIAVRNLIRK